MAYDEWVIGGLTPSWIVDVQYNHENREITLTCRADHNRLSDLDPRSEIEQFQELQCDVISNTQLMNGGSCLQTCNGDPIIITDGVDSWVAALKKVNYLADYQSQIAIDYELILEYESHADGIIYSVVEGDDEDDEDDIPDPGDDTNPSSISSIVYTPSFRRFSNMVVTEFSNGTDPIPTDLGYGDPISNIMTNRIGTMTITEPRSVKQVIIKGHCILLPGWISVNGTSQNWVHSMQNNYMSCQLFTDLDCDNLPTYDQQNQGEDTLTFDITPSKTINILTSTYLGGDVRGHNRLKGNNHGAELTSITVVYE